MEANKDQDELKAALRTHLCVECELRDSSDNSARQAPARCETECTLFSNLPRLARVASEGEPPCGYEVFAKSLQPFLGEVRRLDLPHALRILETAISAHC
jgi:hypothetical protein